MIVQSEEVIYTGHFVKDQERLLGDIPPLIDAENSKIHAHHLTREFKPANGIEDITIGKERVIYAVGQIAMDGVHVVLIETSDGEVITKNEHPHITIATAEGVSPVKSNEVLARAKQEGLITPITPPIEIKVVEGFFDGKKDRTE